MNSGDKQKLSWHMQAWESVLGIVTKSLEECLTSQAAFVGKFFAL